MRGVPSSAGFVANVAILDFATALRQQCSDAGAHELRCVAGWRLAASSWAILTAMFNAKTINVNIHVVCSASANIVTVYLKIHRLCHRPRTLRRCRCRTSAGHRYRRCHRQPKQRRSVRRTCAREHISPSISTQRIRARTSEVGW